MDSDTSSENLPSTPRHRRKRKQSGLTPNKTPDIFSCRVIGCQKYFYLKANLQAHELEHDSLQCTICQRRFTTTAKLKDHKKIYKQCRKRDRSESQSSSASENDSSDQSSSNIQARYPCFSCSYSTSSKPNIRRHRRFSCPSLDKRPRRIEHDLDTNSNVMEEFEGSNCTCGEVLSDRKRRYHNSGSCKLKVPSDLDMDSVVKLRCACKEHEVKQILSRCSTADGYDLCSCMKSAVSNVFPLLCTRLKSMGHFTDFPRKVNASTIKQYLKEKDHIIIPKKIIIKCEEKQAYFGPELTKIPDRELDIYGLKQEDLGDSYILTLNKDARVQDVAVEANDDCNEDDDDSGTDVSLSNSDIFTPDNSGSDSNVSSDEFLPLPNHESTLIESQNDESSQIQDQSIPVQDHNSSDNISNPFDDSSSSSFEDNTHQNSNVSNQTQEDVVNQEDIFGQSQENDSTLGQEDNSNQHQPNNDSNQSQEAENIQGQEDVSNESQNDNYSQSQDESQNCDDTESFPKEKMKFMNMFLNPEKCSTDDINNLIHCTKTQFLDFVESIRPHLVKLKVKRKPTKLSIFSSAFLFRMRLACNWSFSKLATVFVISKKAARTIYNKVLKICYKHTAAIPNVLNSQEDVEKLYDRTYAATDPFIKELFAPFADPLGKGRTPVVFMIDATYQETRKSADNQNNKTFFYSPYHQHVIKVMIICSPEPKVVYILPGCASESPASGDGNLLGNHARMQETMDREALKKLAGGSSKHFPIFVVDTGFQVTGNVRTPEERYKDFRDLVEEEGGIFLGTKKNEYLLRYDERTGEIRKVPIEPNSQLLTALDTAIKFIRYIRCKNENLHAALKQKFGILKSEIPLTYLEPWERGKNITKYTVLAVVCCSLYNLEHPGQ